MTKRMKDRFAGVAEMDVALASSVPELDPPAQLVEGVSVIGGVHMNLASTRL